jgi:hypothetical protein
VPLDEHFRRAPPREHLTGDFFSSHRFVNFFTALVVWEDFVMVGAAINVSGWNFPLLSVFPSNH